MRAGGLRSRLRAWGRRQLYSFFSSLGSLFSHKLGTLLTVLVLGVAMVLPLGLFVTVKNLGALDLGNRDWGTLSVFMQPGVGADQVQGLAQRIGEEFGAAATAVSPEQGMEEFRRASGFGEAMALFEENPLPWVLEVTPQQTAGESIDTVVAALSEWLSLQDGVDFVQADFKWLQRLARLLALGDAFVTVLGALFSLAVVVVVANTIRLDVAGRVEEIQVLQLVGAGNGFIRQPFLYSGFWYGLLGASLALLLLSACMLYLSRPLSELLDAYGNTFEVSGLSAREALGFLLSGAMLGLLGAWLAVQRYFRQFRLESAGAGK
jgi:cell division transport system permease protein